MHRKATIHKRPFQVCKTRLKRRLIKEWRGVNKVCMQNNGPSTELILAVFLATSHVKIFNEKSTIINLKISPCYFIINSVLSEMVNNTGQLHLSTDLVVHEEEQILILMEPDDVLCPRLPLNLKLLCCENHASSPSEVWWDLSWLCTSRAWIGQHGQSVSIAKCYLVNWLWTGSKRMIGSCSDVHLWLQIVFSWQNLSPFLHKNLPIKYIQQQISNQQQQIWSNGNGRRQIDSCLAQWRKGRRGGPSQAIPLDMPLLSLCLSFGLSPSFPLYPLSPLAVIAGDSWKFLLLCESGKHPKQEGKK